MLSIRPVAPKLGAMGLLPGSHGAIAGEPWGYCRGAMGLLPGSHGRIFDPLKCNIL